MKKKRSQFVNKNAIDAATTTCKDWGCIVAGKGGKTHNADIPTKTAQKGAESPTDDSEHAAAGLITE